MNKGKVTTLRTARKPDRNYIEDPTIVKIAKLALILADKVCDIETKQLCIKACERMEYITAEEAVQLMMYRTELERFTDHEDCNEEELS